MPCCQSTSPRPASAASASASEVAAAKRSGETQMPSQPSPNRPARCTAAVERPPTTTGTGAGGAGRIDTEDNEKNSPAWSTVLPARSGQIGRASGRERGGQYGRISGGAATIKKKKT